MRALGLRGVLAGLAMGAMSQSALCQTRTVAITVDDLPYAAPDSLRGAIDAREAHEINARMIDAMVRHRAPAVGFVIQKNVEDLENAGPSILKQWIDAGLLLGNHTYSHADANTLSVDEIESEIVRGEKSFVPLMVTAGHSERFLRFPQNHSGDTQAKHDAVAAFMHARGYELATCTIDNEDFLFNRAYTLAQEHQNTTDAERIREAYLAYTATQIDYYADLNKQVFGYEPPQVMLLHDSRLNADVIDRILGLFEGRGYKFVPLAEAQFDPAYRTPDTFATPYGPMWGYRWAHELHIKVDGSREAEAPDWVTNYK
jgi:peptidoglycan-N-acetylglucosamine deacetylase